MCYRKSRHGKCLRPRLCGLIRSNPSNYKNRSIGVINPASLIHLPHSQHIGLTAWEPSITTVICIDRCGLLTPVLLCSRCPAQTFMPVLRSRVRNEVIATPARRENLRPKRGSECWPPFAPLPSAAHPLFSLGPERADYDRLSACQALLCRKAHRNGNRQGDIELYCYQKIHPDRAPSAIARVAAAARQSDGITKSRDGREPRQHLRQPRSDSLRAERNCTSGPAEMTSPSIALGGQSVMRARITANAPVNSADTVQATRTSPRSRNAIRRPKPPPAATSANKATLSRR
jgi:hypothetical protein